MSTTTAILATQRIRTLLGGPDDPHLAMKMAEIIDEEISRANRPASGDKAKKAARDKRHNAKPHRKKYALKLSRRWQKKTNDESKLKADFDYRRYDEIEDALIANTANSIAYLSEKLGRTRHAIQTRRKKLKSWTRSPAISTLTKNHEPHAL